ncbi:RNA polymerase sigma-70 factor [Microbacterium sp. 22242]|uniref:RNA polymerase sigma-70 factor n=1 Tax=Microbacterium sp. 22242 TaxID=3453896 RepID=UPI003F825660
MSDANEPEPEDPFVAHRGLLFTVAYEMLGSAADAEDVLQESWLRWAAADRDDVRDPRAYLVRIITRQALNQLRTVSRRREEYVGPWLPEPLLTAADVADDVVLAESVSVAMLTVLETLGPTERAVFVLREVFDVPFDEIAAAVGKTPAAVRQIAHRARDHVAARRPRIPVDASEHDRVVERFIAVMNSGDVQGLMDVLAPDVVSVTDSGGLVRHAARRPLHGAGRVVAFLQGSIAKLDTAFAVVPMRVNGTLAAGVRVGGVLLAAVSFAVEDGRIVQVFSVANPGKLAALDAEAPLAR